MKPINFEKLRERDIEDIQYSCHQHHTNSNDDNTAYFLYEDNKLLIHKYSHGVIVYMAYKQEVYTIYVTNNEDPYDTCCILDAKIEATVPKVDFMDMIDNNKVEFISYKDE